MKSQVSSAARKVGLATGMRLADSELRDDKVKIWVREYNEECFQEQTSELADFNGCRFDKENTVTWVHVSGVRTSEAVEKLGSCFSLHPLVTEDIANTNHRPKLEEYGEYSFLVAKAIYATDGEGYAAEQVSLLLGANYVVSFQENDHDLFAPVLTRLQMSKGRIRRMGADFLAYALLDTVVDNYFILLENLGERIEGVEEQLVDEPDRRMLNDIYALKTELLFLRKAIWPMREIVNAIERGDSRFFQETTLLFMRDVYDHTIQVVDTLETYREMVTGMLDIYLSSVSHKLNEIMKVLTIISTIFIPLTFLAGVYGMNFKYMPELEWEWGYPFVWIVMLTVAAVMIRYFRRKRWL